MTWKNFKIWTEWKDVFGFDAEYNKGKPSNIENTDPVVQINVERVINLLEQHEVGTRLPHVKFVNEIHWGTGTGALRCWVATGLNVVLDRLNIDLEGNPVWITKKIFQLNREGNVHNERQIAEELLEQLQKIEEQPLDSTKSEFKEFERLVGVMSSYLRRTVKNIFIYEGIKKINETHYIIRFSLRGHGVEGQDHQRIEENQTSVSFNSKSGLIRIQNYNVESSVGGGHEWAIMPDDLNAYFMPSQSKEEISETIANTLHWY